MYSEEMRATPPIEAHANFVPALYLSTVNTMRRQEKYPIDGVPGWTLLNVGFQKGFEQLMDKPKLYMEWAHAEATKNPDAFAILADGADLLASGCKKLELYKRYHDVVRASGGARVLVGAELCQWPFPVADVSREMYNRLEDRRRAILASSNLPEDIYDAAADGCGARRKAKGTWRRSGNFKVLIRFCTCAQPPRLQFLNSGFIMGPIKAVVNVLLCMLREGETGSGVVDDQHALARCMLAHPEDVTLDYTGDVVLSLAGLNMTKVIEMRDGLLYNKVTGKVPCFVHGNGAGRPQLYNLSRALRKRWAPSGRLMSGGLQDSWAQAQ